MEEKKKKKKKEKRIVGRHTIVNHILCKMLNWSKRMGPTVLFHSKFTHTEKASIQNIFSKRLRDHCTNHIQRRPVYRTSFLRD